MAYQQDGRYLPPQSHQQPFPLPPPNTPPPTYAQQQQAYPRVVVPQFPAHLAQSQQPHPQPNQQNYPLNLTPTASLPPSIPPHYSTPPHADFQYGGISATPGPPYAVPNQANAYSSPHLLYSNQLPPRSQSQPQPTFSQPSQSYPSFQVQPPLPVDQQNSMSEAQRQKPPKTQVQPRRPHKDMQSKPSVQRNRPVKNDKPPIDYQVLLLSLADEYLDAAHTQSTILAVSRQPEEMEQYYKLVATGLGCLEAVLKNWRLPPRTEALVQLRYARILYEETTNDLEAETALSKGIDLCERNRMFDLKYSMQQLMCRIMYKSNPRAAMKAVDGIIRDIEAYRHVGWEYAFRLLRVTLSLTAASHQDLVAALHNLQKISALASHSGDKAVFVVASILEALAHLHQSSSSDSIEQAQRAIATARSHQLDPEVHDIPQINTVIQMIDICCSVLEYDVGQSAHKLQSMQKSMDQNINDPHWREDGSFTIPLNPRTVASGSVESGNVLQVENGSVKLALSWLPEHDLYALCYFLSSVTLSAKNSQDGHKAEKYLQEGLGMMKSSLEGPQEISESLTSSTSRLQWRRILYCNMLLQHIFLLCSRTDWRSANKVLKEIQKVISDLGDAASETIQCLAEYASGAIAQATGDLVKALEIFRQPIFSLAQPASKGSRNDTRRDTAVLANLNTVLILRDPTRPDHPLAAQTLDTLEPFCQNSPNKYIRAAYSLISATIHTESTIQTKRDLHQALQAATAICNSQVTCIALTFMSWKYFRGVIGEQSEKSAMAARAMARKTDDKLWTSVTEELLADTLDRQGKSREAHALRDKADKVSTLLPPGLKKSKGNANGNSGSTGDVRMTAVEI